MKTKTPKKRTLITPANTTNPKTLALLAAARRAGRMVRAENRRWGLPLIVMRNGKIVNEPA